MCANRIVHNKPGQLAALQPEQLITPCTKLDFNKRRPL